MVVAPQQIPSEIRTLCNGNVILAQALIKRGFSSHHSALAFLDPNFYTPAPAHELPDLEKGVERIAKAIDQHQKIGVWGDFDVDGQTSTTILVSALRKIGAQVSHHIPVRGKESHGIGLTALDQFLGSGIELLLTCDTGSSATEAVERCGQVGIDVIVTDHHLIGTDPARPLALINPALLEPDHPLKTLSGAGVAYIVADALFDRFQQRESGGSLLDLVALGMVADLVDLKKDARYLVQKGLVALRKSKRTLINQICKTTDLQQSHLTEEHIGYILAPRLNALGRLDDTNPIVDLFLSDEEENIRQFVDKLEELNSRRKLLCDQVFKAADAQVEQDPNILRNNVLILSHPKWPGGVLGIAASRLVEKYQRPVILLQEQSDGFIRGSARSISGINITELIASTSSLLSGYGGHAMAAGLSVPAVNFPRFKTIIEQKALAIDFTNLPLYRLEIDAEMHFTGISPEMIKDLERMAPFGPGNPAPAFLVKKCVLEDQTVIGREKEHRVLEVKDAQGVGKKVVWWQGAGCELPDGEFDLACRARMNNFRGQEELQIEWIDHRPARNEKITLKTRKYRVIDLRSAASDISSLIDLVKTPGTLVWREGLVFRESPGVNRSNLLPANSLLIATIPPSRTILEDALKTVGAKTVFLGGLKPYARDLKTFLVSLGSLIKAHVHTDQIQEMKPKFAAILGVTPVLIDLGVAYWKQRENTKSSSLQSQGHSSRSPGSVESQALKTVITKKLKEISAFWKYFLEADIEDLIQ